MDDLISRAEAIDAIVSATAFPDAEYIKNLCQNPANSEDWLGGVCDAINAVEDVNAVNAAPVVHGHWVKVTGYVTPGGDPVWACSECGKGVHVYGIEHGSYGAEVADGQWVSCPNCGAKMDKEDADA